MNIKDLTKASRKIYSDRYEKLAAIYQKLNQEKNMNRLTKEQLSEFRKWAEVTRSHAGRCLIAEIDALNKEIENLKNSEASLDQEVAELNSKLWGGRR